MNTYIGDFSKASAGSVTVSTPGVTDIKKVNFTVCAYGSTMPAAEGMAHFSYGVAAKVQGDNGTEYRQFAHSILDGGISRTSRDYCITHYDLNSGSTYRRVSASITSFGTGQITLNFDRADINYRIFIEVIGD